MKKLAVIGVALGLAFGLAGCESDMPRQLTDDERFEKCVEAGGNYTTLNDAWSKGFKCELP